MKKYILPLLMIVLFMAGSTVTAIAATMKAKDYIPNTKKTYIYQVNGFYLNKYKMKKKEQFKNGYWYNYSYYGNNTPNYEGKEKYVNQKDGLYTIGVQNNYDTKIATKQKILPATFKKGTTFKSTFTSLGSTYVENSKIVSTTEKVKIGKKTYKNVVKVTSSSVTNKKVKSTTYYAKGMGKIKYLWTNGESGLPKSQGTTTLSKVIKK